MSILRADSIRDRAGTGAPDFPNGLTGNVTGNADTATALSGTPNITVGIVTGTDATFSGNLTVNGTTTTIDTAVTAVDSLAVDGNITSGGDVSIADKIVHTGDTNTAIRFPSNDTFTVETGGTERVRVDSSGRLLVGTSSELDTNAEEIVHVVDTLGARLVLARNDTSVSAGNGLGGIRFAGNDTTGNNYTTLGEIICQADGTHAAGDNPTRLVFSTTADGASSPTERLRITSGGTAIFKAGLAEKFNNFGTTLSANSDIPLSSGNVVRYTGNEPSNNITVNFTGVHTTLANGESVSFTLMIDPNGTGNISAVQIDSIGPATALKWSGGSAPTAGASGKDIYTFTILKTGTAINAYEVYGAATNYA